MGNKVASAGPSCAAPRRDVVPATTHCCSDSVLPLSSLVLCILWGALVLVQKERHFAKKVKPRWLKFPRLGRSVWRCPVNKKKNNRFSLEAKPVSSILHLLGTRPFFA